MLTAVTLSVAGLYMTWFRGSVGDLSVHLGSTLNAVLIWLCGGMALRYALARDLRNSSPLGSSLLPGRKCVVVFRIGFFLSFLIFKGPFGFDPVTFRGPFLTFMTFAQYLIPLAVLEIYLRAQDHPGALRRMATAGMLFVLTLVMGVGLFAVARLNGCSGQSRVRPAQIHSGNSLGNHRLQRHRRGRQAIP